MRRHLRGVAAQNLSVASSLPPGQTETTQFPVVSTEPPPHVTTDRWSFTLSADGGYQRRWDWAAFAALPTERLCLDLHSVLGWSMLATNWDGIALRPLLDGVSTDAGYAHIYTYGSYTTNLPLEDLMEMPTWIAVGYEGDPIPVEHGGPARLLVPHLYLYKSAKWIRGIRLSDHDEPGTREREGLHNYGDPWREQRYRDDETVSREEPP